MIALQVNTTTGAVVIYGNAACPPPNPPPVGYSNYTVTAIPAAPNPRNGAVLLWQNGTLAWVVPTPTPQQTFDAAVAAGYTVPGFTPPLVLDLGDAARAQFTGLIVLLDKLMSSGQLLATSTQAIADQSGNLHALPVSQIDTILLTYGAYYAGLFNTLHAAAAAN